MADEEVLTVAEVARRLRVHPVTLRKWLRAGKVRGVRLGGTKTGWRIPASEVTRLLTVQPREDDLPQR
jgi:excisionase family DNA binding protein